MKSLLLAVVILAHEPGYFTSLANHIRRWLTGNGIAAEVMSPKDMGKALGREKLAFLVGYDEPSADELRELRAFHERGGKLVVFHSASPALASMMDVKPLGFRKAAYPGQWSRMDFCTKFPVGTPESILQTSTVLQRAEPLPGKGRVIATWSDRSGKVTGDAAWIATGGGFWMTHVLLADGDEELKAQFLSAIVGSVEPKAWNYGDHRARKAAVRKELAAYASQQQPRQGELHAVWEHSGCGLYPGNWLRTMRTLREAKVTDVFVNVAGAAFAHYPSDVLPRSHTFEQEGDQLAAAIAAGQACGIRVHAWVLCFTATRGTSERLADFERRGWRLKTGDGRLTEYLDPSNAEVRAYLLRALDEIQSRYRVDGIHLDFVRWYERSVKPAQAADVITRFVAEARRHVKRPVWLTTAVLGKYPSCIASVGQDWCGWLDAKLVDYVVPMDYTEDSVRFASYVAQHAATRARAQRTIVGIGVTANESRLDARQVIEQVLETRRRGMAGVSLFDLDVTLIRQILPFLRLGLW